MLALRLRMLWNSALQSPTATVLGALFALGLAYGTWWSTHWLLNFLAGFPFGGQVIAERTLASFLLVLSSSVVLSALPNAVNVLYTSEDLALLLALPQASWRVFLFKTLEVFAVTALWPAVLTWPVLLAYGQAQQADWYYYPAMALITLALFAFPVILGVWLALPLVRWAPAGRAREWSAAGAAVLGGLLVLVLRALRPEALLQLDFADPAALDTFLQSFGNPASPLLPSSWAQVALQGLLEGRLTAELFLLPMVAVIMLALAALMASRAYQQGWVRTLEGTVREKGLRAASGWDRWMASHWVWALGWRDLRLLWRDANQLAQLILVGVLVLLYLTSLQSIPVEGVAFRGVVGFLHLAFQGFVIAGVGVRLAFPLLSLEGPAFWLLRTGPLSDLGLLLSRLGLALLLMLPLSLLLGWLAPQVIDLPSGLAQVSLALALSSGVVAACLGVGLGFAFPRFDLAHTAEIPMGIGGLLYMGLSLLHSALLVLLASRPVMLSLGRPQQDYLIGPEALAWWLGWAALTLLPGGLALFYGWWRYRNQS